MRFFFTTFICAFVFTTNAFAADIDLTVDDFKSAEDHILNRSAAFITQAGQNNRATIIQSGAKAGSGNYSEINQNGLNNNASSEQNGDSNFIKIQQTGSYNEATATQNGDANTIKLNQNQDYNSFSGSQQGNNNVFDLTQNGRSTVNLQATGNSNTITANMPNGVSYSISITGNNQRASSIGQ